MSLRYTRLTRASIRSLKTGQELSEHGITFKRLDNGDGRFAINVMVDGQRVHRVIGKESAGVTRNKAEELIEKLKTDARNGRLNLPKGRKIVFKFAEAAKQYLEKLKVEGGKDIEAKTYRLDLHLIPFFKDTPLSKITTSDVEQYKKWRLEENDKPGTINRELAALSHMLNKAIEWKWLEHRPCNIKRFKEEQTRISYLTTEQIKRLIESAKKDQSPIIYAFIVIGLQTSMRLMEILRIRIENIDLSKQMIFIQRAKAGARQQPITKQLTDFLRVYIGDATEGWLFPSKHSKTGHMVSIEKPFRRVVEGAGLDPKEVIRHTLRHTAITHLVQAGVDLPTVQRISGHKTLQMVVRYSHQNGEHIRSAMDVLEKRYELDGIVE